MREGTWPPDLLFRGGNEKRERRVRSGWVGDGRKEGRKEGRGGREEGIVRTDTSGRLTGGKQPRGYCGGKECPQEVKIVTVRE